MGRTPRGSQDSFHQIQKDEYKTEAGKVRISESSYQDNGIHGRTYGNKTRSSQISHALKKKS